MDVGRRGVGRVRKVKQEKANRIWGQQGGDMR